MLRNVNSDSRQNEVVDPVPFGRERRRQTLPSSLRKVPIIETGNHRVALLYTTYSNFSVPQGFC